MTNNDKKKIILDILDASKKYAKDNVEINQRNHSDMLTNTLIDLFNKNAKPDTIDLIINEMGLMIRQFITTERECIGLSKNLIQIKCVNCGGMIVNAKTPLDNICSLCSRKQTVIIDDSKMEH